LVRSVKDLPALKPSRIRLKAYNLKKGHDVRENKNKNENSFHFECTITKSILMHKS